MARRFILIIVITSSIFISVKAQVCCSGGAPISTNLGLPPGLSGVWQFALTYDQNVLRTLKEETQVIQDRSRERLTRSFILTVGYSITDRFSIEGLLPFVVQNRTIQQSNGLGDFDQTKGVGDLLFLVKYRITSVNNQIHTLSLGAGPKLPTGSAREVNGTGLILNADLQPGSGAWDAILWGNYVYRLAARPAMSLYSVATLRLTGVNNNYLNNTSTYEIGNNFRVLLGISDQLTLGSFLLSPSLGARYRKAQYDKFNSEAVPSTGGEWIFLIPGIGVAINPKLALEAGLELPVYANPNGTQLTPTYRFNLGLYYVLGGKDQTVGNLVD